MILIDLSGYHVVFFVVVVSVPLTEDRTETTIDTPEMIPFKIWV